MHYVLTGIAILDAKCNSTDGWWRDSVELFLDIPSIPTGQRFRVENGAPLVTINAIRNEGPSVNAGYAVDSFSLINIRLSEGITQVQLRFQIALADIDSFLIRVGYEVNLTGVFVNF